MDLRVNSINNQNNYSKKQRQTITNTVSFRAISINPNELSKGKTSNFIKQGISKIKEIFHNGVSEKITNLDENYENLNQEMLLRKKIADELPWWRNSEKALRKLNKSEAEQKNELLSEKTKAVQAQVERAETVKKISDEIEKTVKQNDKNKALIKRRQRQDFNDYKGNLAKTNGFSKIAGYNSEKEILNKYFISEIKKEQNGEQANVPNSVLFFGPTGNGKTTFAKAFAKETGCKLIPIRMHGDKAQRKDIEQQFITELHKKAEKSEENFQKTGTRSILFIDEFTKVADKDSTILPELTDFLSNCSDKYHCTLFAASNHPLNIALPMEGEKAVFPYVVSIDPPNIENKTEVMKFYLKGRMPEGTDYEKLAEYADKKEQEKQSIFNIAQLKEDICWEGLDKKITTDEVLNNIDNTEPNIGKQALNKFSDEMDKLLKHEVKE